MRSRGGNTKGDYPTVDTSTGTKMAAASSLSTLPKPGLGKWLPATESPEAERVAKTAPLKRSVSRSTMVGEA